jgi:ribosomal small subunit protein bTHX
MGKGDKKTRRGKLFLGSFGVTHPKNKKKKVPAIVPTEVDENSSPQKIKK